MFVGAARSGVTGGGVTGGEVTGGEVTGGEVTGGEVTASEVTASEVTASSEVVVGALVVFDTVEPVVCALLADPLSAESDLLTCHAMTSPTTNRAMTQTVATRDAPPPFFRLRLDPAVMPWPIAAQMTDVEIEALWLYLQSLPPQLPAG